jgi:hypothetical protein
MIRSLIDSIRLISAYGEQRPAYEESFYQDYERATREPSPDQAVRIDAEKKVEILGSNKIPDAARQQLTSVRTFQIVK